MREVEVKFLDIDPAVIQDRLKKLGAKCIFDGDIEAEYFDTTDRRLSKRNTTLRLRKKEELIELTVKEQKKRKRAKCCIEHEVIVSSMEEARAIIKALGFRKKYEIVKHRISYLLGGVRFELDHVTGIPLFLEIEGENMTDVDHAAKVLGLQLHESKPWSTRAVVEYYQKKKRL
jgi:predicted adenylyl cyclase CyaB